VLAPSHLSHAAPYHRYRAAPLSVTPPLRRAQVHQFNVAEAWDKCPPGHGGCSMTKDRRSTTFLYPRPQSNAGMLYMLDMGGIILKPDDALILCGYAADGGTRSKLCPGTPRPKPSARCIGGCLTDSSKGGWCPAKSAGGGWCEGRPFRPADLGQLLKYHRDVPNPGPLDHGKYNEIVIGALCAREHTQPSAHAQPQSVAHCPNCPPPLAGLARRSESAADGAVT
jgi:hypothetical protein